MEDANEGQITVLSLVIQSITHYELIRNLKAYVIERNIYQSACSFIKQGTNAKTGRIVGRKMIENVIEGHASIYDIFNHQYMLPCYAAIQVSGYLDHLTVTT